MLPKCPVDIFQVESELETLFDIYVGLKPKSVVEIGSWHGGTLWYWLLAADPNAKIVSVDSLIVTSDKRYDALIAARKKWADWVRSTNRTIVSLVGDSHDKRMRELVKQHAGEVDFLYIDGDHSCNGSMADFQDYSPLVRSGGVVAFHDLNIPGIWHTWDTLRTLGWRMQEVIHGSEVAGTGIMWKP